MFFPPASLSLTIALLLASSSSFAAEADLFVQPPNSIPVPARATADGTLVVDTSGSPLSAATFDLSATTVVVGGTAVVAVTATNCYYGCYIYNPLGAPANLCIRETGTALSVDSGTTMCIAPGSRYGIKATTSAVSVNSTIAGHVFSGRMYR